MVDAEKLSGCCDLYLPHTNPSPESMKWNLMVRRFRARLLYLLEISGINFSQEYPLFPQAFAGLTASRGKLMEI